MDKSRDRRQLVVAEGRGDREQLVKGYRIFFRRDESILEVDGSGGCTTSQIYRIVHLKMIFMFM